LQCVGKPCMLLRWCSKKNGMLEHLDHTPKPKVCLSVSQPPFLHLLRSRFRLVRRSMSYDSHQNDMTRPLRQLVRARVLHCFIQRHLACILCLPLFGIGARKSLESSRVISISNCTVSSHVSFYVSVSECSSSPIFLFPAITIPPFTPRSRAMLLGPETRHLQTQCTHPASTRPCSLQELPVSCNCR
jgi:hypothetical protein